MFVDPQDQNFTLQKVDSSTTLETEPILTDENDNTTPESTSSEANTTEEASSRKGPVLPMHLILNVEGNQRDREKNEVEVIQKGQNIPQQLTITERVYLESIVPVKKNENAKSRSSVTSNDINLNINKPTTASVQNDPSEQVLPNTIPEFRGVLDEKISRKIRKLDKITVTASSQLSSSKENPDSSGIIIQKGPLSSAEKYNEVDFVEILRQTEIQKGPAINIEHTTKSTTPESEVSQQETQTGTTEPRTLLTGVAGTNAEELSGTTQTMQRITSRPENSKSSREDGTLHIATTQFMKHAAPRLGLAGISTDEKPKTAQVISTSEQPIEINILNPTEGTSTTEGKF